MAFHLVTPDGTPFALIPSARGEFGWSPDLRAGRFLVYSREGFLSQHRSQERAAERVQRAARAGREGLHVYEVHP